MESLQSNRPQEKSNGSAKKERERERRSIIQNPEYQKEIETLRKALDNKLEEIDGLNSTLVAIKNSGDRADKGPNTKDMSLSHQLAHAQVSFDEAKKRVSQLEESVQSLQAELRSMKAQLQGKDNQIAKLQRELQDIFDSNKNKD